MDVPSPERCANLTAHKALPRKKRRSLTSPEEERITSWIRDASPPSPSNVTFLLPLTPPDDVMGDEEEQATHRLRQAEVMMNHTARATDASQHLSGSATPVNHRSPPTPDLTPPRKIRERKRSPSPPLRRKKKRNSLTPPPRSRQASSAAQSFRTAAERFSPDIRSDSREPMPVFHSPITPVSANAPHRLANSIGLGIGLVDGEDITTPTVEEPMTLLENSAVDEPHRLKAATPGLVNSDPWIADVPSAVESLSRDRDLLDTAQDDSMSLQGVSYIREDDTPYRDRSLADDQPLINDGLAQSPISSRRSVSPLTEESSSADPLMMQAKLDSKRISQISEPSVVQPVEVIVIDDSTPTKKHKLRHANKNASLRDASSSQGGSNRSSLQSSLDYKPRLNQMLGKLPDRTAGSSLFSDSGISMGSSDHIMKRWSRLAGTNIPRRQISDTHSAQQSPTQKYHSPAPSKSASRPATAPNGAVATPELRRTKNRTLPDTGKQLKEIDTTRGRQQEGPPSIPKRGSSLGAPTGRQASGSNWSASTKVEPSVGSPKGKEHRRSFSQPIPITQKVPPSIEIKRAPVEPPAKAKPTTPLISIRPPGLDPASPSTPVRMRHSVESSDQNALVRTFSPGRSSKDEPALMASRALLKTPFSGTSIQSSFTGSYEVHEATTVNIYPHTNNSLLVIQQASDTPVSFPVHPGVRPGAYRVTEISSPTSTNRARQPESMHVTIEGPNGTPVVTAGEFSSEHDHSPLRNPRQAPKAPSQGSGSPPAVNLIPPTPLDHPSPVGRPASSEKPVNGAVALVRRALSGKRTSGASVPRTSGLWLAGSRKKRGDSIVKKKPSRPKVAESSLSPFWQPRRFWDDEEDEEEVGHDLVDEQANGRAYNASKSASQSPGRLNAEIPGPSDAVKGRGLRSQPQKAQPQQPQMPSGDSYFNLPVQNSLGFPQQRIVITGPASLVRRLSSIRRYRSLKRRQAAAAAAGAAFAGTPTFGNGSAAVGGMMLARALTPPGPAPATAVATAARVASPTPSAMAKRRKSQKGRVRFEFNPMRGMSGSSGESRGWATDVMKRRAERKRLEREAKDEAKLEARAEKRRMELRGMIGQPRLETVME